MNITHKIRKSKISTGNCEKKIIDYRRTEIIAAYLLCDYVNISFNVFMSMFICYFKRAFPLKAIYVKDQDANKWIAQDLKVSRKRIQFLNSSNRITNFSRESLN